MARAGVAQHPRLHVDENIGGSDEVVFEFSAQSAIEAGEDAGGRIGVGGLRGEGHFEHGGDERSWDTVAGDIGNQYADAFVVEH